MVTVHIPLPQLSAAAGMAVLRGRGKSLAVLLGAPLILGVAVSMLEPRIAFGVIQHLEVVILVTGDDVALGYYLQVGAHAVVARPFSVTEVDDSAFVSALVG